MEAGQDINERRLADAWAELQAHANNGNPLQARSQALYRWLLIRCCG